MTNELKRCIEPGRITLGKHRWHGVLSIKKTADGNIVLSYGDGENILHRGGLQDCFNYVFPEDGRKECLYLGLSLDVMAEIEEIACRVNTVRADINYLCGNYNPNLYPEEEQQLRVIQKRVFDNGWDQIVQLVEKNYDPETAIKRYNLRKETDNE